MLWLKTLRIKKHIYSYHKLFMFDLIKFLNDKYDGGLLSYNEILWQIEINYMEEKYKYPLISIYILNQ